MVCLFELFIDDVPSAYGGLKLFHSVSDSGFRQCLWIFAAFTSCWNYCNYEITRFFFFFRFYSKLFTSNFCGRFYNTRMDPLLLCS